MLVHHSQKIKKEFKNLKKHEIQTIFTKMNLIKPAFNMIWPMEIIKIQQEEQLLIVLKDKAFNIAKNPKYDGYQRGLASMVYKFFDKKSKGSGVANDVVKQNLQLAEELHKPIIRKFRKRTVYSRFKDNIWVADLADMQLISKFNKGFRFLLCFTDIFTKYAWVAPLKGKKGVSIVDTFHYIFDT